MTLDLSRIPANDIRALDLNNVKNHRSEINLGNYDKAVENLERNSLKNRGIRASMINALRTKILEAEAYLLNLEADNDTFYSVTEPTVKQMEGKLFWVQLISED